MHIKSMRLDGFKSYAQPVEIPKFDTFFNAISGLNGSGKSNILDGICFVLGQSSCKSFRVDNLQQLIFKNGQAGVTKCSVTVQFDNHNKSQSPIGLESLDEFEITRQIILGGKNKYLLNGVTKTNTQISDLFKTVGLNIQSPHFVIMQGRVTKVMNMKPMEVLGMIEEATGTKMYEAKKIAAEKLIEKKDRKLAEITISINEDLTPTLDKLKSDRLAYIQFQKIEREIDGLERRCLAFQVYSINLASETNEKSQGEINTLIDGCVADKQAKIQEIAELNDKANVIEKDKQLQSGDALTALEESVKNSETSLSKHSMDQKSINQEKALCRKSIKNIEKDLVGTNATIGKKEGTLVKNVEGSKNILEAVETATLELDFAEKRFEAVSSGLELENNSAQATSNAEKLADLREKHATEKSKIETVKMKTNHAKKTLPGQKKQLEKVSKQAQADEKNLKILNEKMVTAKYDLEDFERKSGFREGLDVELEQQLDSLDHEKRNYDNVMHTAKRAYPNMFIQPTEKHLPKGVKIDWEKVYGPLGRLFQISDVGRFGTAIQAVLGGKMFNWVIDDDIIGRILVERKNKCFNRSVTVLPLNKIRGKQFDRRKLERARRIAGDDDLVHAAIDLIEYDPLLAPAMEFAFGSTLITANINISNKIAFHKDVSLKCITIDGDVTNPAGTLSGGSVPSNTTSFFTLFSELCNLESKLHQCDDIKQKLQKFRQEAKNHRIYCNELENAQSNYELTKERLAGDSSHRLLHQVKELEDRLATAEVTIKESDQICKKYAQEIKSIEEQIKNEGKQREEKMKKAKSDITMAQKKLKQADNKAAGTKDAVLELQEEIKNLKAEITEYETRIATANDEFQNLETKSTEVAALVKAAVSANSEAKSNLEERRSILQNANKEIGKLLAQIKKHESFLSDNDNRVKDAGYRLKNLIDTAEKLKKERHNVLEDHSWLRDEEKHFGKPGTTYDFTKVDMNVEMKLLEKMKNSRSRMEREVNTKAMNQLARSQDMYTELLAKKDIVEKDRLQILETIRVLDKKKQETVEQAFHEVNKNFRSIFETLLPGATAELRPCKGKPVLEGLEFRVGFGDSWKDNLSELSGGQRSLVALSLILGLLLLKPAPIYILDEIDAALDASHTSNIGRMLARHFKKSQFMIVSLKQGMFSNANVLYRTHFINGVSSVSRHPKGKGSDAFVDDVPTEKQKTTTTAGKQPKRKRTK